MEATTFLYIYLYSKESYPSPNMAFSVIPNKAVAQAHTNIIRPKKIWTGRYEDFKCDAKPGKRKVINPASHWKSEEKKIKIKIGTIYLVYTTLWIGTYLE